MLASSCAILARYWFFVTACEPSVITRVSEAVITHSSAITVRTITDERRFILTDLFF